MKRFSSKVRNISVIVMAVMMLVGLMPTTVLATESECAHSNMQTWVVYAFEKYAECRSGYVDLPTVIEPGSVKGTCRDCKVLILNDGTVYEWKEATEKHTLSEVGPTYDPCIGGHKEITYKCTVCGTKNLDAEGNFATWDQGEGHKKGDTVIPADYLECCGGYSADHYACTVCGQYVDENSQIVGYDWYRGNNVFPRVEVQAVAATTEKEGNIQYTKLNCGHLLAKLDGKNDMRVSAADVIIPKLTQEPAPEVKPEVKPEEKPEVKPETNTPAVTPENSEVKVETTITEVPEGVADKFATVEEIETELIETAIASNNTFKEETSESVIIDVTLMVDNGAGQMVAVTPENFPAEGVEAVLPYPAGTDKDSFDFVITHMITSGAKAGQVEVLTPDPQADGIHVRFTSMSPVVITYQTKEVTKANADENALTQWIWSNMQAGSKTEASTAAPTSPKTFDMTGGAFALAVLCGLGAVVSGKKSKKN